MKNFMAVVIWKNDMNYGEATLRTIFYSSQYNFSSDKSLLTKLSFLIAHNYIAVEKITLCPKTHYLNLASATETRENFDAAGGSPQHVALKLIGQEYLFRLGIESKCELSFCGYTPDVISTDLQTVIECGHTDNIDKLFIYFLQGDIAECIQIPYPDESDSTVYAYRFIPKPNLKKFLLETNFPDREQILSIVNRKIAK